MSIHIVVMGVSGCGKTTVSEAIRDQLGFVMAEGDDFHSPANVEKMSHGIPLTDEDRWPWLKAINGWIVEHEGKRESTVVSCSALKRSYRDVLRKNVDVFFIHLVGSEHLIASRLAQRTGHYMPTSLLPSQFGDLEPLAEDEPGAAISIDATPGEVEKRAIDLIKGYEAERLGSNV
ncbi:gluconokinase [Bifidobacterium sp. ESL0775]|uniref:gluconokinase n=1 Tax=Bifidobacterium sp. ESL0775 TaxID=2983230 RepID=UPI0023F80FD6|nr:gluconokinase [Bifidobacterium sp. ESL0775]WEV68800.1 gluconokinase [Bifidobacterium sp. ESL0775]